MGDFEIFVKYDYQVSDEYYDGKQVANMANQEVNMDLKIPAKDVNKYGQYMPVSIMVRALTNTNYTLFVHAEREMILLNTGIPFHDDLEPDES